MQFPLRWLSEYVDINLEPTALAERLTMAGLEVAKLNRLGSTWKGIYVGTVVELFKHPNADRLWVARVRYGQSQELQVVTGATNLFVGARVPVALPGATLYDGHALEPRLITLKPGKLRGILSEGMVCSEKELGISEDHEGIMLLDPELVEGMPLVEALGDVILDIDVTPNMVHAMSVYGLAREVAAITGATLRELRVAPLSRPGSPSAATVTVEAPELCPRYCLGLLTGISVAPSPPWMQLRLKLSGMRPINNVVDVTNYVMLELGQPLHAFDFETLRGHRIVVRRARPGERIVTLDGAERALGEDMLVIADAERPVAIAGVMGGADTEVKASTTAVALESANFHGPSVRFTSRRLKLRTEAALRFEKGLDPELPPVALLRAMELLVRYCGAQVADHYIDEYRQPIEKRWLMLPRDEVARVLGYRLEDQEVERVLVALGFQLNQRTEGWSVEIPSFRRDVSMPADLIEEVARIVGYDRIPERLMPEPLPHPYKDRQRETVEFLKDRLVAAGLYEVITYSLIDGNDLSSFWGTVQGTTGMEALQGFYEPSVPPLKVLNPLSSEHEYLRPTLMPSLLRTVAQNLRRTERVAIFELGRVFRSMGTEQLPEERLSLGIAMAGSRHARHWLAKQEAIDFYDLKGALEFVFDRMRLEVAYEPTELPFLRPGGAALVLSHGHVLGYVGELHPSVIEAFDIPSRKCVVAELNAQLIMERSRPEMRFTPLPKYPAVVEDISILVDLQVPAGKVEEVIRRAGGRALKAVTVFDRYVGEGIPSGKKSLSFELTFQSDRGTLTDADVAAIRARIGRAVAEELGGQVRGV
jgi:phenylalanyl-tRNA synthetase beta chain